MNPITRIASLASSALALAALSACGGGGSGGLADELNISSPAARLINAVPGGPALQLYRNSDQQTDAGEPAYEQASNYFETVTATSTWSIRDANTGLQLAQTSVAANGSTRYTLIALPNATQSGVDDLFQYSDPYDVGLFNDSARLRVVNGSTNSDAFDVYITAPGVALSTVQPTLSGISYETAAPASGADSYSFPSGTYEVRLVTAGTQNVFFDSTFTANTSDDLLFVSLPNSSTANDVVVMDVPGSASEQVSILGNTGP